ncbi:MAG TPA: transposase [Terriglobia bacterium]|nr:transposase [Terriglobia bacterium]
MARPERIVIPGLPHHITHRGNHRDLIFRQFDDYQMYLRLLRKATELYEVRIWSYALMPNHVHLIAVPERETSLSEAIQWAHGKYAELFNSLYDTVGHLWQGRFGSSALDEQYLLNAVRYVERNPVRAGLVARAEDFLWSSAAAHCGLREASILSTDLPLLSEVDNWPEWLSGVESPEELRRIRDCTRRGKPLGSRGFVATVKELSGRPAKGGDEGSDPSDPFQVQNIE